LKLDGSYTLPLVPGGYVGPHLNNKSNEPAILPVLNLTEQERPKHEKVPPDLDHKFFLSFVGQFSKQGHGVKSWKERLFVMNGFSLSYYDPKSAACKGEFITENAQIEIVSQKECSAPPGSFPFKISNITYGGEYMFCHVPTAELRETFRIIVEACSRQLNITQSLSNIPAPVTGWLQKQGHRVKNWKKRFFVLKAGQLSYYEQNGLEQRGVGESLKGSVYLKGATLERVMESGKKNKDNMLKVVDAKKEILLMMAESSVEKDRWFQDIKRHIQYADQYL